MRLPGVHILLTAGVVLLTSVGTVSAFSLTGSGSSEQELPPAAPPPAAAAPVLPAPPLPAPLPTTAPQPVGENTEPAAEPTRAPRSTRAEQGGQADDDAPAVERPRAPAPQATPDRRPPRDNDEEFDEQVRYACENGYLEKQYC